MAFTTGDDDVEAAINSIAAHGMLNSLTVARAAISTLRAHWERMDAETCTELLHQADEHLGFLGELLGDLARGIPPDARRMLDRLPDRPV